MGKKRVKLFVDGEVLVHPHFSGIGHYTADLLHAVDKLLYEDEFSHVSVELGVPFTQKHKLTKYGFENLAIRGMPVTHRLANGLKWRNRLPAIDLLFGKKVYIFPNYSSWPTLLSPSIPIVYDLSFVNHAEFVEPRNQEFLVDQTQRSVSRATKIVTISKNSKREIAMHYKYPGEDISIVYPAVDLHKFYRRSSEEVSFIKAKYGVVGEYILFVGNIEPRKNLISLLRAYKKLEPSLQKKYGLLLIGARGWLDGEIWEMIIKMRMAGMRIMQPTEYVVDNDLPALYTGASAFAYVSRYEGFGMPPVEALACGVPVLTSDNSSLPEAVGDAAIKVGALDTNSMAAGLTRLLTDKDFISSLPEKGYSQAEKFNWLDSARVLLETAEEAA